MKNIPVEYQKNDWFTVPSEVKWLGYQVLSWYSTDIKRELPFPQKMIFIKPIFENGIVTNYSCHGMISEVEKFESAADNTTDAILGFIVTGVLKHDFEEHVKQTSDPIDFDTFLITKHFLAEGDIRKFYNDTRSRD